MDETQQFLVLCNRLGVNTTQYHDKASLVKVVRELQNHLKLKLVARGFERLPKKPWSWKQIAAATAGVAVIVGGVLWWFSKEKDGEPMKTTQTETEKISSKLNQEMLDLEKELEAQKDSTAKDTVQKKLDEKKAEIGKNNELLNKFKSNGTWKYKDNKEVLDTEISEAIEAKYNEYQAQFISRNMTSAALAKMNEVAHTNHVDYNALNMTNTFVHMASAFKFVDEYPITNGKINFSTNTYNSQQVERVQPWYLQTCAYNTHPTSWGGMAAQAVFGTVMQAREVVQNIQLAITTGNWNAIALAAYSVFNFLGLKTSCAEVAGLPPTASREQIIRKFKELKERANMWNKGKNLIARGANAMTSYLDLGEYALSYEKCQKELLGAEKRL